MTTERSPGLYLAIGIMQAAHSVEECLMRLYDWLPVVAGRVGGRSSMLSGYHMSGDLFAALNVAVVAFLLSISPFVYQGRPWAMRIALIAAVVEVVNGFGHLSAAVVTGAYFPGSISGIGLLILGVLYLRGSRRIAP